MENILRHFYDDMSLAKAMTIIMEVAAMLGCGWMTELLLSDMGHEDL